MVDWSASMQQTFEYYIVDPNTWKNIKPIHGAKTCTINRDSESITRGSATIDLADTLGECYIRVYLITIQNGVRNEHPLGTFLIQTPSSSFDGKNGNGSMEAYSPLLELKESPPPLGYSLLKGENILEKAYLLTREHVRAPVVKAQSDTTLYSDFVAEINDTWVTFISDLLSNAKHALDLDEMGRILFAPKQDMNSLQPVWTYDDGNSSILYPEITMDHDLYGIPNVVEVIHSTGSGYYTARVVNDDPNSPTSTIARGREIIYRESNPDLIGDPTNNQIDQYAEQLLRDLSSIEYTLSYTHAYCPTRVGDCVRLNYEKAGIVDVKARIVSQKIKCETGCPVTEKAVFTAKLWR